MAKEIRNPHPGIILQEEFMDEIGMSMTKLAKAIAEPTNRITSIVIGIRRITADTYLGISKYFGLSRGYWLRLQNRFNLIEAKRNDKVSVSHIQPHPYTARGVNDFHKWMANKNQ